MDGCVPLEYPEARSVVVLHLFSGHYQRYGVNVQACADYRCRFTAMSCPAPEGRNDAVAFLQWTLSRVIKEIRNSSAVQVS
ncbi:hypothetical protein GQ600_26874 [Phytophthora cactorum]|nr:hypothetical protein GQ600_26874 [Phytophthora cactorum]